MTDVESLIDDLILRGEITPNADGTYKLSDEVHEMAQMLIKEHPELFSVIFPSRLN